MILAVAWRRPQLLLLVLAADAVADLAALGLKDAIDRQRPGARYAEPKVLVHLPHDHSFPSGHSATSFACATVLARAAPRYAVPLFALAALIACSRVYVGVHYPLDVIGGAVLGVLVGLALAFMARILAGRRARPVG